MPDSTECSSCSSLSQHIDKLKKELETNSKYTEELRCKISDLTDELNTWKVKVIVNSVDAYTQTDPLETETYSCSHGDTAGDPAGHADNHGSDARIHVSVIGSYAVDTGNHDDDIDRMAPVAVPSDIVGDGPVISGSLQSTSEVEENALGDNTVPVTGWIQVPEEAEEGEIETEEPLSVAESLREAAAAAQQQTGFIYDDATGLYYDKNSGYYYDAEKSLYYEPYSGSYYYFDTETNSYAFHSQADFGSYSKEEYARYCQNVLGIGTKRKKKKSGVTNEVSGKNRKRKKKKNTHKDENKSRKSHKKDGNDSKNSAESQDDESTKPKHRDKYRHKHKEKTRRKTKHKNNEKQEELIGEGGDESNRKCENKRRKSSKREKSITDGDDYESHKRHSHKKHRRKNKKHSKKTPRNSDKSLDVSDSGDVGVTMEAEDNGETCMLNTIADSPKTAEICPSNLSEGTIPESKDNKRKMESMTEEVAHLTSSSEELHTSDSESDSDSSSTESSTSCDDNVEDVSALYYPPCIRLIVKESESLDPGSLYIVPYTGGTVGHADNLGHTVIIQDKLVSKMHCSFQYNEAEKYHEIRDHASQNGTFLNKHRLSQTHQLSEGFHIRHLDILQLGGSTFQLHIHPGNQTCEDCEPGLVQARLGENAETPVEISDTKLNKELKRRQEMKQIRMKYGLAKAPYEDHSSLRNRSYQDRASVRRSTKGSDNPYQKDDVPASVHRALPVENKGHKMLEKMGWKAGDGLGRSQQGIVQPIQVEIKSCQTAGLGSSLAYKHSLDDVTKVKVTERWTKAQQRYQQLEIKQGQGHRKQEDPGLGQTSGPGQKSNRLQFVQGQTETFDIEKRGNDNLREGELSSDSGAVRDVAMETTGSSEEKVTMTVNWIKGQSSKIPEHKVNKDQKLHSIFGIESDSDENG